MSIFLLLFLITGITINLFLVLFSISSLIEKRPRAVLIGALFFILFTVIWFGGFLIFDSYPSILTGIVFAVAVVVLIFFVPMSSRFKTTKVPTITEKIDERDTMFAREEYLPGTEKYKVYYSARPEKKEIDDKIRSLPELLTPGGRYYDPLRSEYITSQFKFQELLATAVDGPVDPHRKQVKAEEVSDILKKLTLHLGAKEVGIACLNKYYVYSHIGRGPEPWGAEIKNNHPFVIAFTLEMNYAKVEEAPGIGITEETALQYSNVQRISIVLAEFIRQMGYSARAHVPGSNYQIVLPPVAYQAGLGEIGRIGYLISPKSGARIRLGAVTTEIPLVTDTPIEFGVQNFCEKCKKCAINCPPGAIPDSGKTIVRGAEKWQLDIEKCFHYWRVIGTDCGLCMKVCPFSHPDTLVHNIIRAGIKRSPFARSASIFGDDLFYGKRIV